MVDLHQIRVSFLLFYILRVAHLWSFRSSFSPYHSAKTGKEWSGRFRFGADSIHVCLHLHYFIAVYSWEHFGLFVWIINDFVIYENDAFQHIQNHWIENWTKGWALKAGNWKLVFHLFFFSVEYWIWRRSELAEYLIRTILANNEHITDHWI